MTFGHVLPAAIIALILTAPGTTSAQQSAPATTVQTTTAPQIAATGYRKLDDMHIVTPAGDKIGEIEDVLIDASGRVVAVAIEAGGFLGLGEKEIVVRLDQLRFENNRFVTTMTKEQIQALPKWD